MASDNNKCSSRSSNPPEIQHLGDGVVGSILNLLDAADGFGADQVAHGMVNHHAVGVEDEHSIPDGQFVESDVSGRF